MIESLKIQSSRNSPTLHTKAQEILTSYQTKPSVNATAETLRELLLQVIKPLFSANPHHALAPSGRKAHFAPAPTIPQHDPIILNNSDKPWKLAFSTLTSPLLTAILATYPSLPPETLRPTIDQQIFLLTPALLNLIDDATPLSKATGLHLLYSLTQTLTLTHSTILTSSGLTSIFIDALTPNLLLLPTLTPEPDSLLILRALYPAYLSLLATHFRTPLTPTTTALHLKQHTSLLRHGPLAGLSHLGLGSPTGSGHITSPAIATFLLHQIIPILAALGANTTAHLQTLLPLLRVTLSDPFVLAAGPALVGACLAVQRAVLRSARSERVTGSGWWVEVLRGLVAVWVRVVDDEEEDEGEVEEKNAGGKKAGLEDVKRQARETVRVLAEVVGEGSEEWSNARKTLVEDTLELEGLFAD
jgi:hypothetical protein